MNKLQILAEIAFFSNDVEEQSWKKLQKLHLQVSSIVVTQLFESFMEIIVGVQKRYKNGILNYVNYQFVIKAIRKLRHFFLSLL